MKRPRTQEPASTSVDLLALRECVEQFTTRTVVLLGDFVADEFQYGEISRVSREAPVLILKHRETQIVPGGGANAANNLASLGARVLPVTAVGDDAAGEALIAHFRRLRVNVSAIFRVKGWTTPTKSRFLAGWAHTVGQQVLRVDYEPKSPLPDAIRKKLHQRLSASLRHAHALAVSDYGFGIATPELVQQVSGKLKRTLHVTLDARYRLHRYAKAGITSATPNEAELEAEHHMAIGQNTAELARAGRATLSEMKLQSLLVTRGRHGAALFEPGDRLTQIPVHGSDQAVDVTGAGDTVLAAYTLALACGATPLEAAHIANIAGGLVVMKRGTATISRAELLDAIRAEASGAAS
ncbi:MAG TPA: bifunctional ADP-heptose synthase [Candidatus Acidoferrales bacterium]|nr:bifunctional ADP-heptose synthase [Candidatus Acidoferrales bacterium]